MVVQGGPGECKILLWAVWGPSLPMEGAICIGTNLDYEKTRLTTI